LSSLERKYKTTIQELKRICKIGGSWIIFVKSKSFEILLLQLKKNRLRLCWNLQIFFFKISSYFSIFYSLFFCSKFRFFYCFNHFFFISCWFY